MGWRSCVSHQEGPTAVKDTSITMHYMHDIVYAEVYSTVVLTE